MDDANDVLTQYHYLGPSRRGFALGDERGLLVFANPSSRRLPLTWVELVRWCIFPNQPNAGSGMWSLARRWLQREKPALTTVISYSDPAAGHTGALYRACNWWWAPTWHRLRPPPTGNGNWGQPGVKQAVKDRWVFPLARDAQRVSVLLMSDRSLLKKYPWAEYTEPGGASYKIFHNQRAAKAAGGG
jgi:hypothetical protein